MPVCRIISWLVVVVLLVGTLCLAYAESMVIPDLSVYREEEMVTTQFPGGRESETTTKSWIKGLKMRTEASGGVDITIVRTDLDVVYNINMQRRLYSESPLSVYQQAARLTMAFLASDPSYQWTGRKKKIGDWNCREVVISEQSGQFGQKMRTIWWVTQDPPLELKILRHVMTLTFGNQDDEMSQLFFEKLNRINSYPVRTESQITHSGQTVKKVQTLTKFKKIEIKDSMFELPSGLTKIKVPLP